MTTTTDLTPFKQHILHFLQLKNVEPPTIERVNQLMSTMDDQHLFLFCEFSFILKRRECDPVKKTGEHAIRDYLQTFWHDENRLVKDLRYADYIHYFTKYNRCSELFDFFKLCTEHGNRKRPLSYTVKLQEFMATPIETLRSRSERKSKSSPKSTSTRISGTKRMKQEESIPCDLQYIPSTKKIRTETQITIKSETTIKSEPFYDHSYNAPVDVFATDFNQQYDEQWSPQSQDSDLFSHPSQSSSPIHSPCSSINSSPQYSYPELETYPQYAPSAAPPTWTRVPSLSNPELCASEADWDAIAQDLNKTYQPIVEAYYQPVYPMMYHHHYTTSQGWFAPSTTHSSY